MVRIAKRGYVEIPSRLAESSRGWESDRIAGLSHHRWLIDVDPQTPAIRFLQKFHVIHSHWRFSFPSSFFHGLDAERRVSWFFWDGSFEFSEVTIHGLDRIASELEGYVARVRPYPRWRLAVDRSAVRAGAGVRRLLGKAFTLGRKRSQ
jgi:hypothetical protein